MASSFQRRDLRWNEITDGGEYPFAPIGMIAGISGRSYSFQNRSSVQRQPSAVTISRLASIMPGWPQA